MIESLFFLARAAPWYRGCGMFSNPQNIRPNYECFCVARAGGEHERPSGNR